MTKTAEEKAAEKAAKEQAKAEAAAAKEAEKAAAEAAKAAEKAAAKSDAPIVVKYRDHRGDTVERTFSKEVHGEGFAAVAEEFKGTNASRLVTE